MLYYSLILLLLFQFSNSLSIDWSFNDQLPLVARVNNDYSFILSPSSFDQSLTTLNLSLANNPSWLSIDNDGSLTGTPTEDNSQEIHFDIIANDQTNSSCSLQISNASPPTVKASNYLMNELIAYGQTNGIDGLVLVPGVDFEISFSKDSLFDKGDNEISAYYGTSANRTALPAWIKFKESNDNLTFIGTAPAINSNIAPSIEYLFDIIATDYPGYTAAVQNFRLIIGAHQLSTTLNSTLTKTIDNGDFSISLPLNEVYLDNSVINSVNISNIYLDNAPAWVEIGSDNSSLTGTTPSKFNSSVSFTVMVYDIFEDSVSIPIILKSINNTDKSTNITTTKSHDSLFQLNNVPNEVNITVGKFFQYILPTNMFVNEAATNVTATYDSDWLVYNSTNLTFSGNAPKSFDDFDVSLLAYYDLAKRDNSNSVTIPFKSVQSSSSTSSSPSSTSTSSNNEHKGMSTSKKLAIILGIIIPILVLLILSLIFFYCYRRRHQQQPKEKNDLESNHDNSTTISNIVETTLPSKKFTEKDDLDEYATAEEELSVAKTISNHAPSSLHIPSMTYSHDYGLAKSDSVKVNNWQIFHDDSISNSIISNILQNNGSDPRVAHLQKVADSIVGSSQKNNYYSDNDDQESISSSLTNVEFTEKFEDEDFNDTSNTMQEKIYDNNTTTTNNTSEARYMDTVEYPEDLPNTTIESVSTDNLLENDYINPDRRDSAIDRTTRILVGNGEFRTSLSKARIFFGYKEDMNDEEEDDKKEIIPNRVSKGPIPKKSWRAVINSTRSRFSNSRQQSINSLATVSTDELFSVRLVDEETNENRPLSQILMNKRKSVVREDSGNIKRLNSFGQEISRRNSSNSSNYELERNSSSGSGKRSNGSRVSNLGVVPEEKTLDLSTEIGRNVSMSTTNNSNEISYDFKLGGSEQSRAHKAYHSRKRNHSQAVSSSSSSSNSMATGQGMTGLVNKKHVIEDSFSFDVDQSLPVIYSPNIDNGDSTFDNDEFPSSFQEVTIPQRNPTRVKGKKRNLSEISSSNDSSVDNNNDKSFSSSMNQAVNLSLPILGSISDSSEEFKNFQKIQEKPQSPIVSPTLMNVHNQVIMIQHHKRGRSSLSSAKSGVLEFDYTD